MNAQSETHLGLAVLVLAVIAGWQIASCELANLELHEDLRDLAAQTGAHIGLNSFNTDADFRNAVVRAAKKYEIQLEPEQVTVQRTGTTQAPIIYLAADYNARVTLGMFFHPPLPPIKCEVNHCPASIRAQDSRAG